MRKSLYISHIGEMVLNFKEATVFLPWNNFSIKKKEFPIRGIEQWNNDWFLQDYHQYTQVKQKIRVIDKKLATLKGKDLKSEKTKL